MAKVKIENKIVGYRVSTEEKPQVNEALEQVTQEEPNVVRMHERLERPEMLRGTTYKIKPPVSDHAMYITINDIVLNQDTEHEKFRPYEIFINSKNLKTFLLGKIQSTSLPVSPLACPEKNWLEDGLRSLHSVTTRASIVKEFIPLYD